MFCPWLCLKTGDFTIYGTDHGHFVGMTETDGSWFSFPSNFQSIFQRFDPGNPIPQ
jgi:hypothetical protein